MSDVSAKIERKKRTAPVQARKTTKTKKSVAPNGKAQTVTEEVIPPPPPVRDERADMLVFITSSGLFDRDFYLSSNQDVAGAGFDPIEHFFDLGFRENRNPNFYFDVAWYMGENEAALQGHIHPLVHYILEGEAQGR